MEIFPLLLLMAVSIFMLKKTEQRKRIALLGHYLGHFQIEKLMESLTSGYMRALGESTPERQDQIWRHLETAQAQLCEQFNKFVADFQSLQPAQTRVSTLALAIPYAVVLFPQATFDLRKALAIHAKGMTQVASNVNSVKPKDTAFTLSAEMLLMQHTCHWFCNSKGVASARLMARHQTTHAQVLAAVSPETRRAYQTLTGS